MKFFNFMKKRAQEAIGVKEIHDRVYFKQHLDKLLERAEYIHSYLKDVQRGGNLNFELPDGVTEEYIVPMKQYFHFDDYGMTLKKDFDHFPNSGLFIIEYQGQVMATLRFRGGYSDINLDSEIVEHPERFVDFHADSEWIGILCGLLYHRFKGLEIIRKHELRTLPYLNEPGYEDEINKIYREALQEVIKYLKDEAFPELEALKVYNYDLVLTNYFENYTQKRTSQYLLPGP